MPIEQHELFPIILGDIDTKPFYMLVVLQIDGHGKAVPLTYANEMSVELGAIQASWQSASTVFIMKSVKYVDTLGKRTVEMKGD